MIHPFILHNGRIHPASSRLLSPGQLGLLSGWGVFSTIRVAGGVLFAWERHWARMARDAQLLRVAFPENSEEIRKQLLDLVRANQAEAAATLRVVVVRNSGGIWEGPGNERDYDLIALTTDVKDWGEGARLMVAPQARHSTNVFAGTKSLSWSMNLCWNEQARAKGFDEALLLNERDEVSECTSANVFIALGDRVYTPPLSSGCLPGVTRDVILTELRVPGIKAEEKPLRLGDLEAADEVFITSTTRDLLPVLSVEGIRVKEQGKVRKLLSAAFSNYLNSYVAQKRTS